MDEQEMRRVMANLVAVAMKELDDGELTDLNLTVLFGYDPRTKPWYEKVKHLFDQENGTKMHEETKNALASVVLRRMRE